MILGSSHMVATSKSNGSCRSCRALGARGSFFLACCCSVSSALSLWVVGSLRVSWFVSVRSLLVWLRQQEIQAGCKAFSPDAVFPCTLVHPQPRDDYMFTERGVFIRRQLPHWLWLWLGTSVGGPSSSIGQLPFRLHTWYLGVSKNQGP